MVIVVRTPNRDGSRYLSSPALFDPHVDLSDTADHKT